MPKKKTMQKYKRKALFFVNSFEVGGAENVVYSLIDYLVSIDYHIVVVALFKGCCKYNRDQITVFNLNLELPKNNIQRVFAIQNMKKIIKNNETWKSFLNMYAESDFDLIQAHLPLSHKLALVSPFANHVIYVMHLSFNIVPGYFRPFHNVILRKNYFNKKISCVSDGIKNELVNETGFNESFCKVIYNPISYINNINDLDSRYGMYKPYILLVGRLTKQKDVFRAINIFTNGKLYKRCNFIILGEGKQHNSLQKHINNLNMSNKIFLKGFCIDVHTWIKNAKAVVCTSQQEGMPMNLLEALYLKTPVISVDCPYGPSEILVDKLSRFLLPYNCSDADFAKKINETLDGEYPEIEDKYLERFHIDNIVKKYLKYSQFGI